jgi:hypothetical protein
MCTFAAGSVSSCNNESTGLIDSVMLLLTTVKFSLLPSSNINFGTNRLFPRVSSKETNYYYKVIVMLFL